MRMTYILQTQAKDLTPDHTDPEKHTGTSCKNEEEQAALPDQFYGG
jgi:hypothetical protein